MAPVGIVTDLVAFTTVFAFPRAGISPDIKMYSMLLDIFIKQNRCTAFPDRDFKQQVGWRTDLGRAHGRGRTHTQPGENFWAPLQDKRENGHEKRYVAPAGPLYTDKTKRHSFESFLPLSLGPRRVMGFDHFGVGGFWAPRAGLPVPDEVCFLSPVSARLN